MMPFVVPFLEMWLRKHNAVGSPFQLRFSHHFLFKSPPVCFGPVGYLLLGPSWNASIFEDFTLTGQFRWTCFNRPLLIFSRFPSCFGFNYGHWYSNTVEDSLGAFSYPPFSRNRPFLRSNFPHSLCCLRNVWVSFQMPFAASQTHAFTFSTQSKPPYQASEPIFWGLETTYSLWSLTYCGCFHRKIRQMGLARKEIRDNKLATSKMLWHGCI